MLLGDIRNDGIKIVRSFSPLSFDDVANLHDFLQPGQIERDLKLIHLKDEKLYLSGIVKTAAHRADQEKRFSEAILLYNIAEEYDSVISVLNVELGNSLSRPSATASGNAESGSYFANGGTVGIAAGQEDVAKVARTILEHYDRSSSMGGRVSRKNRETCEILMRLKEAMTLYEQGRLDHALQVSDPLSFSLRI